jgi:iron complex outermembrane recepter protein
MTTRVGLMGRLAVVLSVLSSAIGGMTMPGVAQDSTPPQPSSDHDEGVESFTHQGETEGVARLQPTSSIPQSGLDRPATAVEDWIAQIEASSLVQITGVQVEETEAGLQVILETAERSLEVPETRTVGNALIADIPNATIAEEFSQTEPIEGIALMSVTSLPGDRVRVAITGTNAPPVAEVIPEAQGLSFVVTLGDADAVTEEDAIQVVVTGEQDDDYYVPDASVGTRTDTPLRDIPQSVQVVPQQLLEDRQARSIRDGLENVSGITAITTSGVTRQYFTARGFELYTGFLVNGIPTNIADDGTFINVERLEVLRGPASVLYGESGDGSLGATVNVVTRQPLSDPFYEVSATAGSFNNYRGAFDFSGPLNSSETILYRLIAAYQDNETFADFNDTRTFSIAPSLSLRLGSNTDLIVEGDINNVRRGAAYEGAPAIGTVLSNPNGQLSRSFSATGPQEDYLTVNSRVGYRFEHRFNENLRLRNEFLYTFYLNDIDSPFIRGDSLADDNRTLNRSFLSGDITNNNYYLNTDILGKFLTGDIAHQLLFGFSLSRRTSSLDLELGDAAPIDIFDPVFDQTVSDGVPFVQSTTRDTLGIYLQDQIALADNLKLLLGGRVDIFEERTDNPANEETSQSDTAFSPRVGIVYQPILPISLYASFAQAFTPTIGASADGEAFAPGRGTQYEIGIRADIDAQLFANLALYDLTRTNVTTTDPNDPTFSVQTGEQNSRGIELDINGEILPGWNVVAGYAYNDAKVTEDNTISVGNRLFGAPEHSFNLWTTYRIQQGDLQGLGFGLGFNYVGDTQANLANTIELPSYFRTDAAIFYERDQFRAALNFRNLFDVEYYIGRGSDTFVYAGEPFTVQGTISWQF